MKLLPMPEVYCKECGKAFRNDEGAFYCSMACRLVAHRRQQALYHRKVYHEDKEATRVCGGCGKDFVWSGGRRKYCSDKCFKILYPFSKARTKSAAKESSVQAARKERSPGRRPVTGVL